MYVLDRFGRDLCSFVRAHVALDVEVKLRAERRPVNGHVRFYSAKHLQHLVERLTDELTAVERCSYCPNYMSIWLKKEPWTTSVVLEILDMGCRYGHSEQFKGTVISVSTDECKNSITCLRIALLSRVVENLAQINGCVVGSNGLNLLVSKKNNSTENTNLIMSCGSVICNNTIHQYKLQKKDNIARVSSSRIGFDEYPLHIISKLCQASIVYELLSVRHSKVISIKCDSTTNKDNGIFIMYNYSRLWDIWTTYGKRVADNCYKPLPDMDVINFGLLTSEEEWHLIFNYLSAYPSVIRDTVKYLLSACVDVHRLYTFLMELSSAVSVFYHRHHVLSNATSSLLPLMYARMYLVKALLQVYQNIFELLGIQAIPEI